MKRVTVITVCLNEEKSVARTIESVLDQTYRNMEFIVKDGDSSDRSNDIIRSYRKKFAEKGIRFLHLTGNDKGIYDAMNIALKEASGEWVNFMNAGDSFYDRNVLEDVFQNKRWDGYGILYGHTMLRLADGYKFVKINHHKRLPEGAGISQQVWFARKELLEGFPFSEKYKILGDFDFLLKAQAAGAAFAPLNIIVANYDRHGVSSQEVEKVFSERKAILENYNIHISPTGSNRFILKIKTIFSKCFPMCSDFLFCKHLSKNM
ncbi:MAG: glycosyltransferase [Blautia sp.]|nr:glycosyltransferase [Blautia sp.]MCM1201827.1 glycosyltransferase [Bacteroides fragilis]